MLGIFTDVGFKFEPKYTLQCQWNLLTDKDIQVYSLFKYDLQRLY